MNHAYTPEQNDWLKQHRPLLTESELSRQFNATFGCSINMQALISACKRRGLLSGKDYLFKKGHETWNKGKYQRVSPQTEFKKGNIPLNTRPIGFERMGKGGVIEVKTNGKKAFRSKHSVLWEAYHDKKIPKGHVVIFVDGNNRNFEKENLCLVSRAELMLLNAQQLRQQHQELRPVMIGLVKLEMATLERG